MVFSAHSEFGHVVTRVVSVAQNCRALGLHILIAQAADRLYTIWSVLGRGKEQI